MDVYIHFIRMKLKKTCLQTLWSCGVSSYRSCSGSIKFLFKILRTSCASHPDWLTHPASHPLVVPTSRVFLMTPLHGVIRKTLLVVGDRAFLFYAVRTSASQCSEVSSYSRHPLPAMPRSVLGTQSEPRRFQLWNRLQVQCVP